MLSPSQLEKFARDGFVRGSVLLDDDQVEILQRETLRVIDDRDNDQVKQPVRVANLSSNPEMPVWQIVNIWQASEPFQELLLNSILVEEVAQIMKAEMDAHEIRLFHDQIQYKPAIGASGKGGGVNMWHQDSPYWPILQPKNRQLTAWVALDDVDEENGCMSMVPGSQLWGNRIDVLHTLQGWEGMPTEWQGHEIRQVPCPVQRGQVHFHHPLTWHGSPSNRSNRPRRAVALHFMTEAAVFDTTGNHPMKLFVHVAEGEKVEGDAFPLIWAQTRVPA